jgi:hypothetical protein
MLACTRDGKGNTMVEVEKLSLGGLVSVMKPRQMWAVLGAIAVLIAGAFSLGTMREQIHSETVSQAMAKEMDEVRQELSNAQSKTGDTAARLEEAAKMIGRARGETRVVKSKAEFLNRYVSYLLVQDHLSAKLFTDFVCVLWKDAQENRLQIDMGALEVQATDIVAGVSPEMLEFLSEQDFDAEDIQALQAPAGHTGVSRGPSTSTTEARPRRATPRLAQRAAAALQKVQLSKTVTFFDNTSYTVPADISVRIHQRTDCQPQ